MDRFAPHAINLGNFLRALGVYLPYLVYSTFLSLYVPEAYVGLVFTFAALCSGAMVLVAPQLFRRFRTHRVLIVAALVATLSLIGLAFAKDGMSVVPLFIIAWISGWTVALSLDVVLEKIVGTKEEATGFSRAIFLTASNIGAALASLIIAAALTDGDYWRVFIIAAAAWMASAYLAAHFFANIPHVEHKRISVRDAWETVRANHSLFAVMGMHFLLQLLFVWTAIYVPLYLHNHAGLAWSVIGTIFALSIIPYIVLQVPIGRLADKTLGEQEFIIAGLAFASAGFAAFSFGSAAGIVALGTIVLVIGVGGAILEISTESYFFKRVDAGDSEIIGVFRALRQFATIAGPLIGSIALFVIPFESIFLVFSALMLAGVPIALSIKDTR